MYIIVYDNMAYLYYSARTYCIEILWNVNAFRYKPIQFSFRPHYILVICLMCLSLLHRVRSNNHIPLYIRVLLAIITLHFTATSSRTHLVLNGFHKVNKLYLFMFLYFFLYLRGYKYVILISVMVYIIYESSGKTIFFGLKFIFYF